MKNGETKRLSVFCVQILIWRTVTNSLLQRRRGTALAVDEEGILSRTSRLLRTLFRCKRIFMPQDKIHKNPVANVLKATSSSTAGAVPLPRWGRLNTPLNCNLSLSLKKRHYPIHHHIDCGDGRADRSIDKDRQDNSYSRTNGTDDRRKDKNL